MPGKPGTEERVAIPAFTSLVHQKDELLFGVWRIQPIEFANVVVCCEVFIANVDQDL